MKIKCCKDCVAPKRHPGCHGVCPEYLYEKALWEEEKIKIYLLGIDIQSCMCYLIITARQKLIQ